jgi:hypothetical protein
VFVALIGSRAVGAQTAVPRWRQAYQPSAIGTTDATIIAARELVDGTRLAVSDQLVAFHFDANGNPLSSIQLPNPRKSDWNEKGGPRRASVPAAADRPEGNYELGAFAAIDPFGAVVLSRPYRLFYYESSRIETMKYDGLTGRPLWARPALADAVGLNGDEFPSGVFLDEDGEVYVVGFSSSNFYTHLTFKYRGDTGEPVWGPTMIAGVSAPGAATIDASHNSILVALAKSSPGSEDRYRIAAYRLSMASGAILSGPSIVDGEGSEYPTACVAGTSPSGGFFVAGESDELYTVRRYDYAGDVLWTARFDPLPGNGTAEATSLALDAAEDVLVTGMAGPRYATYKLSGDSGEVLWGPALADSGSQPQPPVIGVFGNGDALVATVRVTGLNSYFQFTRYRRADGHAVFGPTPAGDGLVATYGLSRRPFFITSNGRIFAVASFQGGPPFTRAFEVDGQTGAMVWGPEPLTLPSRGLSYILDLGGGPDGSVAATGYDSSTSSTLTFKYDRVTGATIWGPVSYTGATYASPYQTLADGAGNVFVLGYTDELPGGAFVIKYAAADGAVVWGPTILQDVNPLRMVIDDAGNAVVTGWTYNASFQYIALTARISGSDGGIDWNVIYDTGQQGDIARTLAVDGAGNVLLVGDTQDNNYDIRWFVLKYAAADGSVMWGPWNGPTGDPLAASTDEAGNLFVTGVALPSAEMTTYKFAAANGAVLWGPVLVEGTGNFVDAGTALVVDEAGDVFVGGYLYNLGTSYDMATVKYRGSDGAVLWGPVLFDGDAHETDYVYTLGMGIDTSGNVVVGGNSDRGASVDAVLLKYEADTGATLWGPVYAGGPGYDRLYGFSVFGNSVAIGLLNYREILSLGYDESFGMTSLEGELPPASCGGFMTTSFGAANGVLPYQWSISSGGLPPGVTLSTTGILSGVVTAEGDYAFTVRAEDGAAAVVDRPMTLHVGPGIDPFGAISVSDFESCAYTLRAPDVGTDYLWLPGGETTQQITVLPGETTTYGVVVSDGAGCSYRYSYTVPALSLQDPDCLAPLVETLSPTSGPAAGGTPLTLTGVNFQPGAEVWIGGVQATGVSSPNSTQIDATSPALEPGAFYPAVVVNPDTGSAALPNAWFADFLDVDSGNPFHDDVVKLVRHGVTAGCGGGNYCPASPVTREQMAVFLLRSKYGAAYVPPPAVGVFADVPPEDPFAPWIEKLHDLGVTSGCGGTNYCPDAAVTRAQMAVFLLKTANGADWPPPGPFGWFEDVPMTDPYAAWIDTLYWFGISGGCNAVPLLYCPAASVNRGQMSAFLVRTFSLQ